MKPVAVIAHTKKTLGGGLGELRRLLDEHEITDPMWFEISSSKKARKFARRAVEDGADLVIAWGGDGTVQRCIDVLAGTGVTLAVIPAGTANLFATNVGIPIDLESAVDVAADGLVSHVDVGVANGEHFGVMAGVGFDVAMLDAADRTAKKRFGKAAYVWTGMQAARSDPIKMQIAVDGQDWFVGDATCLLIGNVPNVIGGLQVFPSASPVSGTLEVGVVTADGLVDWGRVLTSVVRKQPEKSTFVKLRHGQSIDLKMKGKHGYELDGGTREPVKRLEFRVKPQALRVMVPRRVVLMSTAHLVPETRDLSGDDAFETLRRTGRRHLLADAFRRLRVSDGFSHARSLAYLSVLIVVQGTIALVGLAVAVNNEPSATRSPPRSKAARPALPASC